MTSPDPGPTTPPANLLLLVAVFLPPKALDTLGRLTDERTVRTPFGEVGPVALRCRADGAAVWVLPYTGLPARTDPRATLYAARTLGVQRVVLWDVGVAINHLLQRGQTTVATDAIDWTRHQPATFFDRPALSLPEEFHDGGPLFCPQMTGALHELVPGAPPVVVVGVDGPRRESPAEARMFRAWGADVISLNMAPEVMLAQELGLCFAALVTVSEYSRDQAREPLEGEVRHGLEQAMAALPVLIERALAPRTCGCGE